jgi:hypothetical protein
MNDNVMPTASKPKRERKLPPVKIAESGESDGFCTSELINALHGVCAAIDRLIDVDDFEHDDELAAAAKVLSSMVQTRIIDP